MSGADRLAEVMGALSLATDLARGQALESAMGTTILAARLAAAMGLDPELVARTYYTAISRTLGCTSVAMEVAPLVLGDDRSFSYAMHRCDLADRASVRAELERHFAPRRAAADREAAIDAVLEHHEVLPAMAAPTGDQAVALSRRLPLPPGVAADLADLDARWDGKNRLKPGGSDIPATIRIVEFAVVAELFRRAGGVDAVVELAASRSGGQFDPAVCAAFRGDVAGLVDGFDAVSLWQLYLDAEPEPRRVLAADDRQIVAEVAADYADAKSGWFVGHARMVAALAHAAAERAGLDGDRQAAAKLAGLLHDVGRCGVANGVWDKPGPLSARERQVAESHSEHSERILASCAALRPWAAIAGAAHERCDGSGYHHRRVGAGSGSGAVADLVAAADVYVALISDRPWRDALAEGEAAETLAAEASAGRLSSPAVRAVLESSGHARIAQKAYPDGLTRREVEVLALLARGLQTKEIADKLGVAFKTVDNHTQNLYRKIGATSRAAAAMYAVERGIYAP